MKILTLVWSIGIGGTERAAVNYAIGYKKYGQDSRILVLGEGHERYRDLLDEGVPVLLFTKDNRQPDEILKECAAWYPDLIHIHNYNDNLLPYIQKIAGEKTKVVETNVFSRPQFSAGYKTVSLSMQLSGWGYWKFTSWMRNAKYCPPTAIVPYIVDYSRFKTPSASDVSNFLVANGIPADAFVIGRLGQPHPSKWDTRIIKVINNTINPENNIYYFFVGLPTKIRLLVEMQSSFFKSRVVVIDRIEGDENLSIYYHSLNCFAHISKIGESFGYVLAEVMLCKVPVISMVTPFKDNAQLEVIGQNIGGFCVTDINDFIAKLLLLHRNDAVRKKLISNLCGWIEKRYSYEAVVPGQLALYKRIIGGMPIQKPDIAVVLNANFELYKGKRSIVKFVTSCIHLSLYIKIVRMIRSNLKFL